MEIIKDAAGVISFMDGTRTVATINSETEVIVSLYKNEGKERVMLSSDGLVENAVIILDASMVTAIDDNGTPLGAPANNEALIADLNSMLAPAAGGTTEPTVAIVELQTSAVGATYVAFPNAACVAIDIVNHTGTDIEYRRNGAGATMTIKDGESRFVEGITNSNQISLRRVDVSNTQVTVEAETFTA